MSVYVSNFCIFNSPYTNYHMNFFLTFIFISLYIIGHSQKDSSWSEHGTTVVMIMRTDSAVICADELAVRKSGKYKTIKIQDYKGKMWCFAGFYKIILSYQTIYDAYIAIENLIKNSTPPYKALKLFEATLNKSASDIHLYFARNNWLKFINEAKGLFLEVAFIYLDTDNTFKLLKGQYFITGENDSYNVTLQESKLTGFQVCYLGLHNEIDSFVKQTDIKYPFFQTPGSDISKGVELIKLEAEYHPTAVGCPIDIFVLKRKPKVLRKYIACEEINTN